MASGEASNSSDRHEHHGVAQSLPIVEASGENPDGHSRRDFLRIAGFALAGGALAGCQRAPVQYAVPYLTAPAGIAPGRSYAYATTCGGCSAACGVLAKTRDGRPIKLEGNPGHPLSHGGLCAVGQASLLGLYDQERLQRPRKAREPASWAAIDEAISSQLDGVRKRKEAVRFLTGPIVGPTFRALLQRFLSTFANAKHVVHDPRSCSAIPEAHERTHGIRILPHYQLDLAEVIVGFEADFLGTWISPVEFTAAYQLGRNVAGRSPRLSYHVQFESLLSLTGSKADRRFTVTPAELGEVLSHLVERVAKKAGASLPGSTSSEPPVPAQVLDHLADYLWRNQQRSLILCGSQDVELQVLTNYLNHLLGNYGTTVDISKPSGQRQDNDRELEALLKELQDGKVAALFVLGSNPVHDLPSGVRIAEDLKRVPLMVSLSPRLDETAELASFVCPDHHYLESWGDAEPVNGLVSLAQPAIAPLADTRSALESVAAWTGKPKKAYDLLRDHWEKEIFPRRSTKAAFREFWDQTLHDGFAEVKPTPVKAGTFQQSAVHLADSQQAAPEGTYALILYAKVGMPDSGHAYNPWLHELPDPISKITWDNYACLAPATAKRLGVSDGDVVRVESEQAGSLELPVFVQPGLHDRAVGIALGYGSVLSRRFATVGPGWLQAAPSVGPNGLVGTNAANFLHWVKGSLRYAMDGVRVTKTGRQHPLASTQGHNEVSVPARLALPGQERRPIIQETALTGPGHEVNWPKPLEAEEKTDLWPDDHPEGALRWGMVIDLNRCTGCSACVIACQAENNVAVVGKDEVRRHREMHWLRIDRYYTERDGGVDVAHQPMLCQQCGNAPCEVVCPVLATVHSEDGLNQQAYNRCVGTRYCANNCPYKVRRFNWFDYAHNDLLQNLALNPDVTVRTRGVMEKCTFCVQRLEEAKIEAGGRGRPPRDGAVKTACQESCPAQAITFGNLADPKSNVHKRAAEPRAYQVLGELNIRPAVSYLTLVRNRPAMGEGEGHG